MSLYILDLIFVQNCQNLIISKYDLAGDDDVSNQAGDDGVQMDDDSVQVEDQESHDENCWTVNHFTCQMCGTIDDQYYMCYSCETGGCEDCPCCDFSNKYLVDNH